MCGCVGVFLFVCVYQCAFDNKCVSVFFIYHLVFLCDFVYAYVFLFVLMVCFMYLCVGAFVCVCVCVCVCLRGHDFLC